MAEARGPNNNVASVAELGTLAGAQMVVEDLARAGIPSRIISESLEAVGETSNVGTFVVVVPSTAADVAFNILETDLELIEPADDMGFLSGRQLWQQVTIVILASVAILMPIALALAALFNSIL